MWGGNRPGPRGVLGAVRRALVFTLRAVGRPGKVSRWVIGFDTCLKGKIRPHVAHLVAMFPTSSQMEKLRLRKVKPPTQPEA